MVFAYILYAVLFKEIVNLTLVLFWFFFVVVVVAVFRKKVNIINIYLARILYWNIFS